MLLFGTDGRHDRVQGFLALGASVGVLVPPLTDALRPINLSGIVGVGFTAPLPHPRLSWGAEALYMHGLYALADDLLPLRPLVITVGIGIQR